MTILDMLRPDGRRSVPLVRQSEAAECGLTCLAMVAGWHGHTIDLANLRRRFPVSLKGATLQTIMQCADKLGFSARALRGEIEDLSDVALPVILHWNLSHFVVLTKIKPSARGSRYLINDPAAGERFVSRDELSQSFTGVCLELSPTLGFQRRREVAKVQLFQLWSRISGLGNALSQSLVLSLILQVVALATPFYIQTAIDTALPAFDADLLTVLAIGFAGVVAIQFVTQWLRSLVLLNFGTTLGYQLVVNLYRHMMRLPLPWFERRHVGDIVSRFTSTQPIVQLLSQGLIAAGLDAVMAMMTLALMFVYSAKLAAVALIALLLFLGLRFAFLRVLRARNFSMISANAVEQSAFIESVRGISGIKAFAQESNRQHLWQNKKAIAVNAQIRIGRMQAGFDAGQAAILGIEQVVFVYLAIKMAMSAELSVGMIFAYQAYKQQFLGAGMRVLQAVVDWQMADMHLGRLSDIALSPTEEGAVGLQAERPKLKGKIELRNVCFRYGIGEAEVLKDVNLVIEPGKALTIVGPSGGGKTTLLKIMLGLIDPTDGEVLVDDVPLKQYGKQAYRWQTGAVLQDDVLYAGSLAENIGLFDPEIDMDRVREAALRAMIADEIAQMPMGYESLVGDMGSSLSGGQRQRVLLARALYRQPAILFGDEVTASLDAANSTRVMETLINTEATLILVTHTTLPCGVGRVCFVANGSVRDYREGDRIPINQHSYR